VQSIEASALGEVKLHADASGVWADNPPPYARIGLDELHHIRVDRDAGLLVVAEQVAYRVLDVDHTGVTLVCQRVDSWAPEP
jgi:hypothetical protein